MWQMSRLSDIYNFLGAATNVLKFFNPLILHHHHLGSTRFNVDMEDWKFPKQFCSTQVVIHCKNKNSGKPPSSVYTEEKVRMENPDFKVDFQSSSMRWRHQSHMLHKKIKSPLPFTPIHLFFRIYVWLCPFYNLIKHNLVRYSILKVYTIFCLYNQRTMMK